MSKFNISYTDIDHNKIVIALIAGRSKSGRTTFASTFPKPFFVNVDRGLKSIADKHIPMWTPEYGSCLHEDYHKLLLALADGKEPFNKKNSIPKTWVLDTLTAFSLYLEEEVRQFEPEGKGPRGDGLYISDYNTIQKRITAAIITTKEICSELGINFLCITSTTLEKDELEGGIFETPSVTGNKLSPLIPTYFDDVYYIEVDPETNERILYARPIKGFPYGGNKHKIKDTEIVNPTYEKLKKYYKL